MPHRDKKTGMCYAGLHPWIPMNVEKGSCKPCNRARMKEHYRAIHNISLDAPPQKFLSKKERKAYLTENPAEPEIPRQTYPLPTSEEIRTLFLAMIEQALWDITYAKIASDEKVNHTWCSPIKQETYDEAMDFLMDPDFRIHWDAVELSLEDILVFCGISPDALSERLQELGITVQ